MGLEHLVDELREDVRRLGRRKGHTESKTFIVGGAITSALYIPPLFVGIDADSETPEWKQLIGFAAVLRTGTATIKWKHNGTDLNSGRSIGTTVDVFTINRRELEHGDTIRLVPTAATSAFDLSAAAFIVTAAG